MAPLQNFLAVFLTGGVVLAVVADMRRDVRRIASGRNVVLVGIGVWFLHEAVKVPDALRDFTQSEYDFGVLCVAAATASFLACYHQSRGRVFASFGRRLAALDRPQTLWPVFLTSFAIGIAPLLYFADFDPTALFGGIGRFGRAGGVFNRGRYGGLRDAILELQMFLKAALPIAIAIVFNRRSPSGQRAVAGAFLTWMLARAAFDATRSNLLMTGLPILAGAYWVLPPRSQKLAVVCGLPTLAVAGFIWSVAMLSARTTGEVDWAGVDRVEYTGNEMFRELLSISSRVPSQYDYRYGETYYVQLVNPIPRFLWPGKPVADAGLELARMNGEIDLRTGEPYLTRSPGIIGEMYWNFGLVGIFVLSGFGGWLVRAWDAGLVAEHPRSLLVLLSHAAGLAALFLFGRSVNMATVYGLISLYVLVRLHPAGAGRGATP